MGNRFAAASRNFLRKPWRKFWWLPLWAIFEIIRDRLAGWVNSQIDKQVENQSGRLMEMMARSVDYLVSTPLSWTISGAIIILILLFLHSYFVAKPPARKTVTKPAQASVPLPTSEPLATNAPSELITLPEAVLDAWERIRTLPEFDTQPSHSPEFASLRDYYEREPAKLPGIAAQIIFNRAVPLLPIEGVFPPRTAMEVIPHDKAAGYRFSDDAAEMFDLFDQDKPAEQRRRYTKLRVKRTDIERRVRAIEEDNGKR